MKEPVTDPLHVCMYLRDVYKGAYLYLTQGIALRELWGMCLGVFLFTWIALRLVSPLYETAYWLGLVLVIPITLLFEVLLLLAVYATGHRAFMFVRSRYARAYHTCILVVSVALITYALATQWEELFLGLKNFMLSAYMVGMLSTSLICLLCIGYLAWMRRAHPGAWLRLSHAWNLLVAYYLAVRNKLCVFIEIEPVDTKK